MSGFITTAGPPSLLVQPSKVFLNADVRAAAKGLSDALLAAGIDLKDEMRHDAASGCACAGP